MGRFHRIFGICPLLREQIFQNVFEELQAGDGIEGILGFLHSTATAELFRD